MKPGELVTLLAYAVGAGVLFWAARTSPARLPTRQLAVLAVTGLLAGAFGAKLTQLVFQGWPFVVPAQAALDPRAGGRALLGGLLFGWTGVEVAKRRLGIRRSTGDLFALALPAGEAVGRIGCFLNGCCTGIESRGPFSVLQDGVYRQPSQLYSAAAAALIFISVLIARRAQMACPEGLRPGSLFRLYLLLFSGSRFLLEFTRYRETLVLGLSPMQWFCLEMLAVVGITTMLARRKAREVPA